MSTAPRTEAAFNEALKLDLSSGLGAMATFADGLEVESDQLAKRLVKQVEVIATLRKKLEHAEACLNSWVEDEGADAKRLDWLLCTSTGLMFLEESGSCISRAEIDEAMGEGNAHE